jgi:hypothetical protein
MMTSSTTAHGYVAVAAQSTLSRDDKSRSAAAAAATNPKGNDDSVPVVHDDDAPVVTTTALARPQQQSNRRRRRQQQQQQQQPCWRGVSVAEAMNPARRSTMEDVCVVHGVGEWGGSGGGNAHSQPHRPLNRIENQTNNYMEHEQRKFKEDDDNDDDNDDCLWNMAYIGIYDGHGGMCVCVCVCDFLFRGGLFVWANSGWVERVRTLLSPLTHSVRARALQFLFATTGREMVDFLRHALEYHVARELRAAAASQATHAAAAAAPHLHSTSTTTTRRQCLALENAFLLADIHAHAVGIHSSGATVAVCLLQVRIFYSHSKVLHVLLVVVSLSLTHTCRLNVHYVVTRGHIGNCNNNGQCGGHARRVRTMQ